MEAFFLVSIKEGGREAVTVFVEKIPKCNEYSLLDERDTRPSVSVYTREQTAFKPNMKVSSRLSVVPNHS